MINPHDSLRYSNVISCKYRFHYEELEEILKEFVEDVLKLGLTPRGPLFYSINNLPTDETLHSEIFMPVEEDYIYHEEFRFHSYFSIEGMAGLCIFKDVEQSTELAYGMLLEYMEQHGKEQITPFFHVLSGDETLSYVFIKAGMS